MFHLFLFFFLYFCGTDLGVVVHQREIISVETLKSLKKFCCKRLFDASTVKTASYHLDTAWIKMSLKTKGNKRATISMKKL